MNTVFVDTSALIALANIRDNLNLQAENTHKKLINSGYQFITTSYIMTEFVNYMSSRKLKFSAKNLIALFHFDRFDLLHQFRKLIQHRSHLSNINGDKRL